MRTNLTGVVKYNGLESKVPYLREGKTATGAEYKSVNFFLQNGKNNSVNVEIFAMKQDPIKTMNADGEKIEIAWADRNDEDIIKSVAGYRKHTLSVDENRTQFIADLDFVDAIIEHIDELNGNKVTITGQTNPNVYNGNVSQRFQIQNIYEADEDAVCKFKCTDVLYFNKESINSSDWKSEQKLYINGWISQYLNKKDLGTDKSEARYVPIQVVLDGSKLDLENEKHVKLFKARLMGLGCKFEDGKIVNKLKTNKYYANAVELEYQNGAVEAEFDESMLTDYQKMLVELGEKSIDDFRPTNSVYGERVTVFKLKSFDARGDYADGMITLDTTASDFEKLIFTSEPDEEKLEDIMDELEDDEDVKTEETVEEDDDDDLF